MGQIDCEMWELLSELNKNTTDYTKNGKCSNCGECCSHILPVSNTEIKRIKRYITKHHIKLHNHKYKILCPFRNEAEKKMEYIFNYIAESIEEGIFKIINMVEWK